MKAIVKNFRKVNHISLSYMYIIQKHNNTDINDGRLLPVTIKTRESSIRLKQACSATKTSKNIEILHGASLTTILYKL